MISVDVRGFSELIDKLFTIFGDGFHKLLGIGWKPVGRKEILNEF
jgi:hypothetical protein